MKNDLNSLFTADGLGRIQSAIKYNRVWQSVISLTFWGVICIIAWAVSWNIQ